MRGLYLVLSFFLFVGLTACEEVVDLKVPDTDRFFVVNAVLTNQVKTQSIQLFKSQNYFDNNPPESIQGAKVVVTDNAGNRFEFTENASVKGLYEWRPVGNQVLGKVGSSYQLSIDWNGEQFEAFSKMNRVPPIDSIRYKKETANLRQRGEGKPDEGFEAHFYARDPIGVGDCYRLRTYKNGKLFDGSNNLTVMFDSNFQKGAQGDGLMFISPVRSSISPELYLDGDSLTVELLSITEGQFDFYFQARQELNNAGLFSRPAANIPTNVVNKNKSSKWQGAGWFGVSAVSRSTIKIEASKASKKLY